MRRGTRPPRATVLRSQGPWVLALVIGIVLFESVRSALVTTNNIHYAPALILLGAATVPFAFVLFLHDRRSQVEAPAALLGGVALIGGVVGVVAAGLVEFDTLRHLGVLPVIVIAIVEEVAKLLTPAALLFVPGLHRTAGEGLVVGVAAGAGFAVLETMGYALAALVRSHDNVSAIDATLFHRGLLGPASHMAWTGLTVAALWLAAAHRWRSRFVLLAGVAFSLAVALHTCWDAVGTVPCYAVLAGLGLGLLFTTAHFLADREGADPRWLPSSGATAFPAGDPEPDVTSERAVRRDSASRGGAGLVGGD